MPSRPPPNRKRSSRISPNKGFCPCAWQPILRTISGSPARKSQPGQPRKKVAFVVELLPGVDNLERALTSGFSSYSPQLRQDVEMTLRLLHQLLRQHGVGSDDDVGRNFDPHGLAALSHGHDPAQPDHAILLVAQRGYRRR